MENLDTERKSERVKRARNHFLWLGPVVVFAGAVSYFLFFVRFAALRDFPWVNLPIVIGGVLIALLGARRVFAGRVGLGTRLAAVASAGFSAGLAVLFGYYVFGLSYHVPKPTEVTLGLSATPEFALRDQDDRLVRLSDYRGRRLVLAFYRGHW